jgi:hypothetical protein
MRIALSVLAIAAFMVSSSANAIITVGPDKACNESTLQAGIGDTKGTNNEIHVESSYKGEPSKQTVRINDKIIVIIGGYNSCAAGAVQTTIRSTLNGTGTTGDPLIAITGDSHIDLRNFTIENGHNVGSNGGGIAVNSSGKSAGLTLTNVDISTSTADKGGGLFYAGAASTDTLTMIGTTVEFNSAVNAGGGVRIQGDVHMTMDATSSIRNNTANPESLTNKNDGHGGGLQMLDETVAVINGSITGNTALAGAGISLHDNATVAMYASANGVNAVLSGNTALNNAKTDGTGGGVFYFPTLEPFLGGDQIPTFCGNGVTISGNTALDGAAMFNETVTNDDVSNPETAAGLASLGGSCFDVPPPPCPNCVNVIENNTAMQRNGAIFRGLAGASYNFSFVTVTKNNADHVFRLSEKGFLAFSNCLITNNAGNGVTTTDTVNIFDYIDGASSVTTTISGCTIANNSLAQPIFSDSDNLTIDNSLIWQPTRQTISQPKKTTVFTNLLSQDGGSFSAAGFKTLANVNSIGDPQFANAAAGDFHLLESSPAVDYSATGIVGGIDMDGKARGKTLKRAFSPFDVGAFERQTCRADDDVFCDSFE